LDNSVKRVTYNLNVDIPGTQHERYPELCAIFTTGSLTGPELRELKAHLENCRSCCQLLCDYEQIVGESVGAAASENLGDVAMAEASRSIPAQKQRLFAQIARNEASRGLWPAMPARVGERFSRPLWFGLSTRYVAAGLAAAILLVGGYLVGARRHDYRTGAVPIVEANRRSSSQSGREGELRASLGAVLRAKDKEIASLSARIDSAAREVQSLQQAADEAAKARDTSNADNARLAVDNANLVRSREELERLTNQAQSSLASVQQELALLRTQRERDLEQSTDLQTQVAALASEAASREKTMAEQRKLLDSDKDIRDLMGARELYIADVYDVDSDTRTPKPFGRVFYTKHKSLIFYAFDLDQQVGVRAASTFQAWGLKAGDKDHPMSMGVFYKDNDNHRRWQLKFEDSQVLDQIQAVFVTVEPAGGSHKPRGRQLLYASLRMTPNHP
jgi:hypothetical protein